MKSSLKKNLFVVLIAATTGIVASMASLYFYTNHSPSISQKQNPTLGRLVNYATAINGNLDFTQAADATLHAVVHVKTKYQRRAQQYNPFNDPWGMFGTPQPRQQESSGSGVILTEDGYIATNNHVIDDADEVEITLNDNRTFTAKVIGTDPSTDLALLKIDEKNLPFVTYGNSDDVKVGEWVLAVGNPFNLNSTVTAGIISAKARNIGILPDQYKIESFLQTDAAVNPGNSGGALVNTQGQLVGINSAIASTTGAYAGYSFAIPVNLVKKVMDDLVEFGAVQRGFIGVSIRDIDSKLANEKGISETKGVYVAGTSDGGAAAVAGIKEGDVILKVGDVAVNSTPALQEQVGQYRPGDKINVTIDRNGTIMAKTVILKNKEGNTSITKSEDVLNLLGATFENTSTNESNKLAIDGGVKITNMNGGKLRSAGIKEGFIITQIDKKPIRNVDDLNSALRNKTGGVLIEGVYPNGMRAYYGFGL
ncbi:MAG: hypothetical protein RIQ89_1744 [Bacteroidota bacterium]|jgi:Do/DeqQ family serine protease